MTEKHKEYFELSLDSLRILAGWAASCAERALDIYEGKVEGDPRPRAAVTGAREFAEGGKRAAKLRLLAMDAYRAGRETDDPAARAAAQAASLAAASAFTHPLVDPRQTKHILGPAAYAALALEIMNGDEPGSARDFLRWALERARKEIGELLGKMPRRKAGRGRVEELMDELDGGLRGRL